MSAQDTESQGATSEQPLNDNGGGKDIKNYDQCILGCADAVDYCEKHQSQELNCSQKGAECMEYCDWAFPRAVRPNPRPVVVPPRPGAGAAAVVEGIATSPIQARGIATSPKDAIAVDEEAPLDESALSLPLSSGCKPTQTCVFTCFPPNKKSDIYTCRDVCTWGWTC